MKKLSLAVETLRVLDGAEAQEAHGGQINTYQTCTTSCNTAMVNSMCICIFTYRVGCTTTTWAQ